MICRWPVGLIGSESGRMMSWPGVRPGWFISARFCECVRPVTVIWSPSKNPLSIKNLIMPGVPPMFCTSSITYLPDGFRSARNGVLSEMRWKSSRLIWQAGSWHERDIAIRWSTAFVEPPVIITIAMAFSKAALVMMSRGLRSSLRRLSTASPTQAHSSSFSFESAGLELEYGSDMPRASIAVAMVFAVYMPPHAPWPGQLCAVISRRSSSVILS
mmetsp:Transcript_30706/g.81669  ORF Transcript_30706/g.81669 Transcript_30706/m.81669 type:complete len:215 (-) Transcript_30706:689-1333(-)